VRLHVLGLSHTRTTDAYSVCAFTQKVRLLCKMMGARGHEVFHYGTEGSVVEGATHVPVLGSETFERVHDYDWRRDGFRLDHDTDAYREFAATARTEILRRARKTDILCCTFGLDHKPIVDGLPNGIPVETGIGYDHTFARFRVFESYAWLHFHYGKEGRGLTPDFYDAVIPNAVDPESFPRQADRAGYHIMLTRDTPLKGLDIAERACAEARVPLYVAGQGGLPSGYKAKHLGVLGPKERAEWVGRAAALWAPTKYIEPFGTVAVEAAAAGTPVITTDVGAFTETVLHGITGYRCRTHEQFVWAAQNVDRIDPEDCRRHARNYHLDRVARMYEEYLRMVQDVYRSNGWYTERPDRTELDWLARLPARE
jgi:glycosyltransferase involved in cell wall biosynthesis